MPAVHVEPGLRLVKPIGLQNEETCVRSGILLILFGLLVLEVVRTAEVVFSTGTAYGGEVLVAIKVELDFAFTPPTGVVRPPAHRGANVLTSALNAINDGIDALIRQRVRPAELSVEIQAVFRNLAQSVVDLIVEVVGMFIETGNGDSAAFLNGMGQ